MNKIIVFFKSYYPEFLGLLVAFLFPIAATIMNIEVSNEQTSTISSLAAQILATYLGLVLATFGVLYGLNLKRTLLKEAEASNLDNEIVEKIRSKIQTIYNGFIFAVSTLAAGTILAFIIYSISVIGTGNVSFLCSKASFINSICIGGIFGFMTTGTINIVSTVRTILELSDI